MSFKVWLTALNFSNCYIWNCEQAFETMALKLSFSLLIDTHFISLLSKPSESGVLQKKALRLNFRS